MEQFLNPSPPQPLRTGPKNRMSTKLLRAWPAARQLAFIPLRSATVSSKIMPVKEDKSVVETDAEKLCKYVCINYFVEGEEPGPPILPDSEYPKWLFKMQLEKLPDFEDMDPEVHGWLYWNRFIKRQREQAIRLEKLKYKRIHLQNAPALQKPKLWKR